MKTLETRAGEARTRAAAHRTRIYAVVPRRHYRTPSESKPGVWYDLTMSSAGIACSCDGFTYTGMCRHAGGLLRRLEREGIEGRIANHR